MATATEPTIEQRLAALEAAVAAIRVQLAPPAPPDGPARGGDPAPTGPTSGAADAAGDAPRPAETSSNGEHSADPTATAAGSAASESYVPPPIKRAKMDDQGRMILPTPAEAAAEAEAIRAMLDRLATIESDPDEDDAAFFRAIDSHRPHRPVFEGLY